jgi:DNA-directed RNA polymerase II subunit RPB1
LLLANKPIMGIVQDILCSICKSMLQDTFLDWNQVQNILLWVPGWDGDVAIPAIIKPGHSSGYNSHVTGDVYINHR